MTVKFVIDEGLFMFEPHKFSNSALITWRWGIVFIGVFCYSCIIVHTAFGGSITISLHCTQRFNNLAGLAESFLAFGQSHFPHLFLLLLLRFLDISGNEEFLFQSKVTNKVVYFLFFIFEFRVYICQEIDYLDFDFFLELFQNWRVVYKILYFCISIQIFYKLWIDIVWFMRSFILFYLF